MVETSKPLIWWWFLAMFPCACQSGDGDGKTPVQGSSRNVNADGDLSGTYFGVSSDGRGWLMFVDPDHRFGSLYIPPSALQLCELTLDPQRVSMRWSPGRAHVEYVFEGTPQRGVLTGQLKEGGVPMPLNFRRVANAPAGPDFGRSGYYSNIGSAGGESGGLEFVFVNAPQQPVALLTFYEGSPGKQWAAQHLTATSDSLRFSIVRNGRVDTFPAVVRPLLVTISSPTLGMAPARLSKRATIAETAHDTWKPDCPDSLRIK